MSSVVCKDWVIKHHIATGGYGFIYTVQKHDGKVGVAKVQKDLVGSLDTEIEILRKLEGKTGFTKIYGTEKVSRYTILIMQRLPADLFRMTEDERLSVSDVLVVGMQVINRLKELHRAGYIHRDVHPGNIMVGERGSEDDGNLFLIDFGLCEDLQSDNRVQRKLGYSVYSSTDSILNKPVGRKDDIESLIYVLVNLSKGLPWTTGLPLSVGSLDFWGDELAARSLPAETICSGLPLCIAEILDSVRKMRACEEPNYDDYISKMMNVYNELESSEEKSN